MTLAKVDAKAVEKMFRDSVCSGVLGGVQDALKSLAGGAVREGSVSIQELAVGTLRTRGPRKPRADVKKVAERVRKGNGHVNGAAPVGGKVAKAKKPAAPAKAPKPAPAGKKPVTADRAPKRDAAQLQRLADDVLVAMKKNGGAKGEGGVTAEVLAKAMGMRSKALTLPLRHLQALSSRGKPNGQTPLIEIAGGKKRATRYMAL